VNGARGFDLGQQALALSGREKFAGREIEELPGRKSHPDLKWNSELCKLVPSIDV